MNIIFEYLKIILVLHWLTSYTAKNITHNNIIFIMCSSAYSHASSIIYDKIVLSVLKKERSLTFGRSENEKNYD